MTAYCTRDSVAAGDDGDAPHGRQIELPPGLTVTEMITAVIEAASLPSIQGGRATWCVASGVPIAVIAQEWPTPKMLHAVPLGWKAMHVDAGGVRLHFSYFAQRDPDVVFDVLRRLTLRAQ